jgi:VIT1/CCC1 family predicted Fe2+/Mn2+ transporter
MSFKQKNITVSFISNLLILGFFLIRLAQLIQSESFLAPNVFRLWGTVIVLTIVVIIVGTIFAHVGSAVFQAIQTGGEEPQIEDIEDERDKLIDLKGTQIAYIVFSIGGFLAMLTFVFGQAPLVMFTLLIFAGIMAQITGDISRLVLYRRGF